MLPPPAALQDHVYERYLPPVSGEYVPLEEAGDDDAGLERLDPVCLMDIDPATARYRVGYNGRTVVFCAPACKKQFLANPEAYLVT